MRRHLLFIALMLLPLDGLTWNEQGHEVIAQIAWTQLDVATKAKVSAASDEA